MKKGEGIAMKKDIEWLKDAIWYSDRNMGLDWKELVLNKINQLDEPEVLSAEWIDEHRVARVNNLRKMTMSDVVPVDKLQDLLVPKQELPVIPKYVAEWIENIKPDNSLRVAFEYIAQRKADNHDDPLALWIEEGNSETFAKAWIEGYEVEKEPLYYALIKGHELVHDYDKSNHDVFVSRLHPPLDNFTTEMSKEAWKELGINETNADFVKVEE